MLVAAFLFSAFLSQKLSPVVCPITGDDPMDSPRVYEYEGAKTTLCCEDCPKPFAKDPAKAFRDSAASGKVVAVYLFDPVNGGKIDLKMSRGFSDYKGIRFGFGLDADKKLFDADPKRYGAVPSKEALYCPVFKRPLKTYDDAGGFVDYEGVRYYVCCSDCLAAMGADPAKYAPNAAAYVQAPKAIAISAK